MRTRASRGATDSMDLLLDTICNTFGGVLFIAILVILLLPSDPADSKPENKAKSAESQLKRQQLTSSLTELSRDLARLRSLRTSQQRTVAALAPYEIMSSLSTRANLEQAVAGLQLQRSTLLQQLTSTATAIDAARDSLAVIEAETAASSESLQQLQQSLESAKKARRKEIRTPVAHEPTALYQIQVVVQYNRLYVIHDYDAFGIRTGLNTDDFMVTDASVSRIETTARPTRGIELIDGDQCRERIRSRFRNFSSRTHYFAIILRPDSHDSFAVLRDVILGEGYEYQLLPVAEGDPVADRGGRDSKVQ